jgi:ParB/RepB/Spo0J family partition protein
MQEPTLLNIPMSEIFADDSFNCRGKFRPIDVAELAKDIEKKGLIQPIVVAPIQQGQGDMAHKYKLIAGHRRHMAHRILKADTILALVRLDMQDEIKARSFNLTENLQRQDLDILQEANAIRHLALLGLSRTQISAEVGKSTGWVQVRVMLLSLPSAVQEEIIVGSMSTQDIRDIYTVFNGAGKEACFKAVRDIKEARLTGKKKPDLNKKEYVAKNTKRHRKLVETQNMLDLLHTTLGGSLATRSLAWAAGAIDDREMYDDIQKAADLAGKVFLRPKITLL